MEQATNQFTRGLQMDTHPMVQGNDTLTDCLNGTLITMNGDEVILQNDMGNRRVDLAFLHAGYEPVGIKEYGGIIYIAAYNPITNQSQIGCFPSPLRKYVSDSDTSNELLLDLTEDENSPKSPFSRYKFSSASNIYAITSDIHLIRLTDKIPLCPGDKFLTSIEGTTSLTIGGTSLTIDSIISNFNNIKNNNIKSRKNKQYTLSYGILNSQNQFVDITKSLMRWNSVNNNNTIIANSGNTEIDFNKGYFLPISVLDPIGNNSINDIDFEKLRLKFEMNTYSGKLVGYPYIRAKLNHPESFSYSFKGKNINGSGKLIITGTIKYNCPISCLSQLSNTTKSIFMLFENQYPQHVFEGEVEVNNSNFNELIDSNNNELDNSNLNESVDSDNNESVSPSRGEGSSNSIVNYGGLLNYFILYSPSLKSVSSAKIVLKETYDEVLNLYSATVEKTYDIDLDKLFSGFLGVPVSDLYSNYIVGSLILPVSIDPSLFDSNKLYLTSFGWKKDEDGRLFIRYHIDDYLYDETELLEVRIGLTDLTGPYVGEGSNIPMDHNVAGTAYKSLHTDLGGINVLLDTNNLKDRHYYAVNFSYKYKLDDNSDSGWINVEGGTNLWLLNTPLLNNCYEYVNNEYYIENYCNRSERQEEIFNEIAKIEYDISESDFKVDDVINDWVEINDNELTITPSANITDFYNVNDIAFDISIKHKIKSTINVTKKIKIKTELNYPADIGTPTFSFNSTNSNDILNLNDSFIINYNSNILEDVTIENDERKVKTEISTVDNSIKLITTYYDFFKSLNGGSPNDVTTLNCMHSVDYLINEMYDYYLTRTFSPVIHCQGRPNNTYNYGYTLNILVSINDKYNATDTTTVRDLNNSLCVKVGKNFVVLGSTFVDPNNKECVVGVRSFSGKSVWPNDGTGYCKPMSGQFGNNEELSNVCCYYSGGSFDGIATSEVNSGSKSYVYLRSLLTDNGSLIFVVLPGMIEVSKTNIILKLKYYFDNTGNRRMYIQNSVLEKLYTTFGAKDNAVYTLISPKGTTVDIDKKPTVTVNLEYTVTHNHSYTISDNTANKGCYFSKVDLDSNIKEYKIDIESYRYFRDYVGTNSLQLDGIDTETGNLIGNYSYTNRHIYNYEENNNNYIYTEVNDSNLTYIKCDGKCFPTLKPNLNLYGIPITRTFFYVKGKYNQLRTYDVNNDTTAESLYFYGDFVDFNIYDAKTQS